MPAAAPPEDRRRYPDIDLGIFHLGATKVASILVTMDADQGIVAVG